MDQYYYLIKIQYCGFRFSGWQKQTNSKTIQEMVDKTISFIMKHDDFKTLGTGRTDAKVSANEYYLELFISEKQDVEKLLENLNHSLPPDIRALEVKEVDDKFNIIGAPKLKEYLYLFTLNSKPHPFSAPYIVYFDGDIDIELMKKGAKRFEGKHNFKKYCYKPSERTIFDREIESCEIIENNLYTANFFPEKTWILKVKGKGFLRHQLRMMMGTLISLGRGDLSIEDVIDSLKGIDIKDIGNIAPSSGLMLNSVELS
jgi:tRNA pseudouridine38-40 synthase